MLLLVLLLLSSSMYMSSDDAQERLSVTDGDIREMLAQQINYIIFAICYPLFATHTLKGPKI